MDYPAKILLFGEYGIILNSMALAIPYPHFSGRFSFIEPTIRNYSKAEIKSGQTLRKLLDFFKSDIFKFHFLDIERFKNDLNRGLYFDSSVPVGSGLGSSGAVTAALYDCYLTKKYGTDYPLIKRELADIETFFHGLSSGFDPLISLIKRPVLLERHNSIITEFDLSPFFNTYKVYLIRSHSQGHTGKLVSQFLEKYRLADFKEKIDHEYVPLINQTIKAITSADFNVFDNLISKYSIFQLSHFSGMIPMQLRHYFEHGINSGDFTLKLCGSGGGGYILGIARNQLKAETYFNLNHLDWTVV